MSTGATVALKFIWYLLSRLLIGAVIVGLVVLSFFSAMDYMNVQTLVKDGLHVRADVILTSSDTTTLSKIFSKGFLEADELLITNPYKPYDVSDYNYNADVSFALIAPWNDTVTVTVTEEVTGIKGDLYDTSDTTLSETPPEWVNAVYTVTLVRYEDNWRIKSMEQTEILPAPTPSVTPSPSPSPSLSSAETDTETSEVVE